MAYTRTLTQLRTELTQRGGFENSADLTSTVLTSIINDALQESYEILLDKFADYFTLTQANQSLVAGTASYAVPTDFYKLRKVELLVTASRWARLLPHDLTAAHLYADTASKPRRYRIQARNVVFVPTPSTSGTYRLWYIPLRTELSADGDTVTFDVPNEHKLVLAIAWRDCLDRQELDPSPAIAKVEAMKRLVERAADGRDAAEPFYLDPRGPVYDIDDDTDEGRW